MNQNVFAGETAGRELTILGRYPCPLLFLFLSLYSTATSGMCLGLICPVLHTTVLYCIQNGGETEPRIGFGFTEPAMGPVIVYFWYDAVQYGRWRQGTTRQPSLSKDETAMSKTRHFFLSFSVSPSFSLAFYTFPSEKVPVTTILYKTIQEIFFIAH